MYEDQFSGAPSTHELALYRQGSLMSRPSVALTTFGGHELYIED